MATTRTMEITVTVCDACGRDCDYPTKCLECDKAYCYSCREKVGVEYNHSVFASGSGDGFYCFTCDRLSKSDVHAAYCEIARMRRDYKAFHESFNKRSKEAEAVLVEARKATLAA